MPAKNVKVVYVAAMTKEESGTGSAIPAHVKLEWVGDEQGRTHKTFLVLTDEEIAKIAAMPDADSEARAPAQGTGASALVYLCGNASAELHPSNGGLVEFAMSPEVLSDQVKCSDSCGIVEAVLVIGQRVRAPVSDERFTGDEVAEGQRNAAAAAVRVRDLCGAMFPVAFEAAVEHLFYELRRKRAKARREARKARSGS